MSDMRTSRRAGEASLDQRFRRAPSPVKSPSPNRQTANLKQLFGTDLSFSNESIYAHQFHLMQRRPVICRHRALGRAQFGMQSVYRV